MAKEGNTQRKKGLENILKTNFDGQTLKGVADAFLLAAVP